MRAALLLGYVIVSRSLFFGGLFEIQQALETGLAGFFAEPHVDRVHVRASERGSGGLRRRGCDGDVGRLGGSTCRRP
jgi:hypothetical protein